MPTDYFNNVYTKKLDHKGDSWRGKALNRGVEEFERYLAVTPTRQDLKRLLPPFYEEFEHVHAAITNPSGQSMVGDRYELQLAGSLTDNWQVGDLFQWHDDKWIVLTQEMLAVPTYFKGKVRLCNYYLKWQTGEEQIYEVPGHIITSRAFALEQSQKSGIVWDEQAMVITAIVPQNDATKLIKRYQRFIIKNKAWSVVNTDLLSVSNLLFIRLEEDQINRATDDLDNGIADKWVSPGNDSVSNEYDEAIYEIRGNPSIIWNGKETYTIYRNNTIVDSEDIAEISVDEPLLATTLNHANPVEVRANSDGKTGEFNLICTFTTGHTINKPIRIRSLWG